MIAREERREEKRREEKRGEEKGREGKGREGKRREENCLARREESRLSSGSMQLLFASLVGAMCLAVPFCLHKVDEGNVGIYYSGGALLQTYTEPGYHLKLPYVTTMYQVQVTVQTDAVTDIPCGTSGGVLITFGKIEVVNRLKKDTVLATVKNYTVDYDKLWIFDRYTFMYIGATFAYV